MAVLDPDAPPNAWSADVAGPTRDLDLDLDRTIRVEPLIDLEWSRAVEPTGPIGAARRPSQVRRAWIHRAPETQVVNLYNSARLVVADMSAPWWLRALAAGSLQSRLGGFAVEDQVSDLLAPRPGWFYMPWTGPGEDGYWEYVPSDETASGRPLVPTTLMLTDRHTGWLDVFPAHAEGMPHPIAVRGPAELRVRLPELELVTS
ncbi:MAG TPA: hypothetical protein VFX16_17150 [Pseudonocardiaceae bacterium]|nr:hypothetical protein [Pseudonocardiaceae bacterium]